MTCSKRLIIYLLVTIISTESSHHVASPSIKISLVCLHENSIGIKCFNIDDPKISNDTLSLFPVLDENNTLVFDESQEVLVGIACTASFPVEWIFHQEKWLGSDGKDWYNKMRSHSYSYKRTVKTLEDVSSYTHESILYLHNIQSDFSYAIGGYTCQSSDSSTSAQPVIHMSVFTEREIYEKTLPLSGRNVTVWTNEGSDGTIIFPCYASYPNATVNLYKKNLRKRRVNKWLPIYKNNIIETWDIILPRDKLSYKTDQGFIYRKNAQSTYIQDILLTPGSYKCAVADEDNDDTNEEPPVMINLQDGYAPVMEQSLRNTVSHGAFVNYTVFEDRKTFQVICCSSSSVPPDMYMISCTSKTMCDRHQRVFSKLELNFPVSGANRHTILVDNCRKSKNISYSFGFPLTARCIGDGVNYSKTLIFPFENNTLDNNGIRPYEKWEDIDPLKMLTLKPLKWDKRSSDNEKILLYNDQNITFQCSPNMVYFEIGSRITINLQNRKRILLEDTTKSNDILRIPQTVLINVNVKKDFESISCHAPVLNSNQWISKTLKIKVLDGEAVNIAESDVIDEIYWTLNEKSKTLQCQFSGVPRPVKVEWRKDNQVIHFPKNTTAQFTHSMVTQNTSILLISLVTYDIHGVYECVIGNMYGNKRREFRVIVRAPDTSWIIFSASLGLICLAAILMILGLCMKRQRKHLNVLMRPYENSVD